MRLDVAHRARIDPGFAVGRDQQVGLCSGVGSGERTGTSPMIFRTPQDHPINMVTCSLSLDERLEHEHPYPFAPHVAIGLFREAFTSSIRTEHPCFTHADVHFGGNQRIDPTDDGHATLSTLDGAHPPMNGDQR